MVFLIPPFLVVSIVFRLAYGWKAKKAIKSSNPWENFGVDSEIRSYDKKNIKFVLSLTECLLSIISLQLASFLLYYFVCPWQDFAYQGTFSRVLSI